MLTDRNARDLHAQTIDEGGLTVEIGTGLHPRDGYAVPYTKQHEHIVSDDDVDGFVAAVQRIQRIQPRYLGTWHHRGHVYVEPVDVMRTPSIAINAGRARGHIAIHNLETGKDLYL